MIHSTIAPSPTRLRILYVTHGIPSIPAPGGATRAFHLVQAASEIADVTLLGVVEPSASPRQDAMERVCSEIHQVPAPHPHHCVSRLWRLLPASLSDTTRRILTVKPVVEWRFDAAPLRDAVSGLLRRRHYDLVIVEHTEIAWALHDILREWGGATVADLHNVISAHEARVAQSEPDRSLFRRFRGRRTVRRLQALERDILRSYTRVSSVSAVDAARLQDLLPNTRIGIVPNGVDIDYFGAVSPDRSANRLIFTGALWYRPNVDGLRYFISAVWPLIRRRRPETHLSIVGARPPAEVQAMGGHEGVDVFGSVEDVRPYLRGSSLAVVPLRLGTGTRLKILEALAAHLPVVSTSVGAEGLDIVPGRDYLQADAAEDFAAAVLDLLDQPAHAGELAERGNQTVRQHYNWDAIALCFQRLLGEVTWSNRANG